MSGIHSFSRTTHTVPSTPRTSPHRGPFVTLFLTMTFLNQLSLFVWYIALRCQGFEQGRPAEASLALLPQG